LVIQHSRKRCEHQTCIAFPPMVTPKLTSEQPGVLWVCVFREWVLHDYLPFFPRVGNPLIIEFWPFLLGGFSPIAAYSASVSEVPLCIEQSVTLREAPADPPCRFLAGCP
jgi:hypothetical protein